MDSTPMPPRPPSPKLNRAQSGTVTLPLDLFSDLTSFTNEKEDQAADTIASAWQRVILMKRRRRKHLSSEPSLLSHVRALLDAIGQVSSLSFADASALLASSSVVNSAKSFLSSFPKDELLLKLPRDARSPRAFLSLVMIVHHTSNVLNEEEDEAPELETARELGLLKSSARLTLSALDTLAAALSSPCVLGENRGVTVQLILC